MTSIVLADDHHNVRQGLRALLQAQPGLAVVGETGDGLEVPGLVARLRPDVLVLDLAMPGLGGLEATRRVTRQSPGTRVIILSMYGSEAYALEALRCGARGYVLKSASPDLVHAIRQVAAGRRYLSPPLSEEGLAGYAERARGAPLDPHETLTAREREVLHLAAEGLGNPEVAVRLGISVRTAETHRANLMRKLGLRSQTELVRYAIRRGVLPVSGEQPEPIGPPGQ